MLTVPRMISTLEDFRRAVAAPADLPVTAPPLLRALWHGLRDEWAEAHGIAQNHDGAYAAWIHAWLHRVEGDLPNARYWYHRAGKPEGQGDLAAEGYAIAAHCLRP